MTRLLVAAAGAAVAFTVAVPAHAQGKGKGHKSGPPSSSVLPDRAIAAPAAAGAVPFAWIDDASLIAPGTVALSIAMARWEGADLSEIDAPIVSLAAGFTGRL